MAGCLCLVVLGSPTNRHMPQSPYCFKNNGYHSKLPHSAKAKGPPAARACHPHAERRNCNFLEFTNRPSTPKPPPKAHRPPLSIHNQSDSQRQWITFHLICVPRARARGSKFHAETNFSLFPATEEQQRQMNSFQPPGPSQPPTNIVLARPSPPWAAEQPAPPQNAQISRSAVLPTTKHAPYLNCPGANRGWTVADF